MKSLLLAALGLVILKPAVAQDSTGTKNPLTISGYAEAYYNYDFNRPLTNTVPGFLYNFNRAGEVNLNLGFIKANYTTDRVRANLALGAGTYVNANYAAEPGVLKNVFEANIGLKISKNANLWIDAGIMPSHIGFESAIGKDNWALTRSLVAENTPYFESGLKIGFTTKDEKLYISAMYLNGWQRIQRVDGNTTPAFGTQVTYKPVSNVTLNYSTFTGSDKPDSARLMRFHHNFYGVFQLAEKFGVTAGFDYGTEQKVKRSSEHNHWFVPVLIARYSPLPRLSIAARGEYFQDKNGVIIATGTENGFRTFGVSANIDYTVFPGVLWRVEARNLSSKDRIFLKRNQPGGDAISKTDNFFLTTSLSVAF
ncbi:porin [Dyadobacter psychrophilus]|uniref:Putative beta-barrel porin-2, OmpL-like. bbp2 n=1 Tax=Dyadobacter psychrophilus TaxID=651661 RepID=A0A1T5E1Y6_9BACT|nr:porin [Dyadobacter psychrophilus]SKB77780.1 Putative beta-barrel porin-2, OmpL-like. bbp2 [Dyadobacter psychrophilus]